MTDFLQWWADHWPLIPVLIAYPPFVMWITLRVLRWWVMRNPEVAVEFDQERRREP